MVGIRGREGGYVDKNNYVDTRPSESNPQIWVMVIVDTDRRRKEKV